jgi:citrate lyase subunit beta/citryl-CoA lyase
MRSKIFMPGDRPDLLSQMLASKADSICLDLEDTVTPDRKAIARKEVAAMLATLPVNVVDRIIVRVNGTTSDLLPLDLDAVVTPGLTLLNLPKAESADEVRFVCDAISRLEAERGMKAQIKLFANIESPRGLRKAAEIATASPRLLALQIGYADLLEPFRIERTDSAAIHQIRLSVRMAAAEAGIEAYDGVYADVSDASFFRSEAEGARRLGFMGKSCFDSAQVAIANEVFTPSTESVRRARRVVEAAERAFADGTGLFVLDGRIVDAPFVQGARQVLARAAQIAALEPNLA